MRRRLDSLLEWIDFDEGEERQDIEDDIEDRR